jgi:hypothetical protein
LLNVKVGDRKNRINDCCNVSIVTNENSFYDAADDGVVLFSVSVVAAVAVSVAAASFSRDDAPDDEAPSATAPSDEIG